MHRLHIVLAAVALLVFGLVSAASAQEAKGVIKGSLKNITAGGGSVADQEVMLLSYSRTKPDGPDSSRKVRSDRDGQFVLDGLQTGPEVAYQLSAQFQGVPYFSEPLTFTVDSAEKTVEVQVADSISDAGVVKVASVHYVLEADPAGLGVLQILALKNSTDKTYVGATESHPGLKETLRISVPADAQNLEPGSGFLPSRVFPVEGGLSDSSPIYPGDSQRTVQYTLPATGDAVSFSVSLPMAAEKVNVLVPDTGLKVSVSNLPTTAPIDMGGTKYVMISGQNLAAGTELKFTVEGITRAQAAASAPKPATAPAVAPRPSLGIIPLVAGGAALLVVVVVAVFARRARSRTLAAREAEEYDEEYDEQEDDSDPAELEAERGELVEAIAELDDSFEAGKIGSEEYGRLRAEKKQRLVEIVEEQRSLAATGSGR